MKTFSHESHLYRCHCNSDYRKDRLDRDQLMEESVESIKNLKGHFLIFAGKKVCPKCTTSWRLIDQ